MSGACYAGDLLGKPLGAPGLAEYFYENEAGVCVKQASYVPSPYPACRDIDALARFSRRATRERPLPAAVEAVVDAIVCKSNPRPTPRKPPGFPRRAADRPSPHRAASSAASPSSPSPPVTVSCSASASSSPSSPPPWYVHAVRSSNDGQLRFGVSQNAFLDFPRKTHTQGFPGSIGERFLAKPLRDVDASTRGTQTVFRPSDDFFVLAEKIVRWKKNAPPLMNLPSR
jgi:hypothetical protein